MNQAQNAKDKPTRKQEKRERRLAWKEEKWKRKLARKDQKRTRKLARLDERIVVGYRARLEMPQVTQIIEDILSGLKSGAISVDDGDQQLTLNPSGVVDCRVRARRKFKSESITIRVRWPRSATSEDTPSVQVSSP